MNLFINLSIISLTSLVTCVQTTQADNVTINYSDAQQLSTINNCFLSAQKLNMGIVDDISGDTLPDKFSDSVKLKSVHKNTYKPSTDFDQRFSFIRSQSVNIWGQRAGVVLNDWLKFGIGVYYMSNTKMMGLRLIANSSIPVHYSQQSLVFGTGYIEPFLIRRTYWELSVPFEIGFGKSFSKVYNTSNDSYLRSNSKDFIPTGAGLSLSVKFPTLPHFKPLSWIGVNFLAGYRYCLLQNDFKTSYDGAFWSVSGAIFLDRISDDYRAWKRNRKIENN